MTKKLREITQQEPITYLADGFLNYLHQTIQEKKNAAKEEAIQEGLDSTLEEFGFTDEAKTKAAVLFNEAVENKDSRLRVGITNLLGIYSPLLEGADVIDALGDRIVELEESIAYVEGENQKLSSALKENLSESYHLDEAVVTSLWNQSDTFDELEQNLQQATKSERRPKRSFVEDDLGGNITYDLSGEINEDSSFANGPEHVDPRMAPYLRFLK